MGRKQETFHQPGDPDGKWAAKTTRPVVSHQGDAGESQDENHYALIKQLKNEPGTIVRKTSCPPNEEYSTKKKKITTTPNAGKDEEKRNFSHATAGV